MGLFIQKQDILANHNKDQEMEDVGHHGNKEEEQKDMSPAEIHNLSPAENHSLSPTENHGFYPAEIHGLSPAENHSLFPAENSADHQMKMIEQQNQSFISAASLPTHHMSSIPPTAISD